MACCYNRLVMRSDVRLGPMAFLGVVVLMAAVSGCGPPKPQFIREPYLSPRVVAVLPFSNHSNDLKAPVFMRKLAMTALAKGGYSVMRQERVDEKLRGIGITQGGQLRAKTPVEIAKALGADALFYGRLESASHVMLGVYLKRKIAVAAELFDARGDRLWKHAAVASSSEFNLDVKKVGEAMARQLAEKWVESMLSHPLYPEMRRSLYKVFITLPSVRSSRSVGHYIRSWRRGLWHAPRPSHRRRRR